MATSRPWRQEIELIQNFAKHATITLTTSGSTAEDVVVISGNMEEANRVSLVVELGDAYIEFDDDASTSSMYIPQDEGYFDDNVYIGSTISIIRAGSTDARIRGIAWGR